MAPIKIKGDPAQMRAIAFKDDRFMATLFTLQGLTLIISHAQQLGMPGAATTNLVQTSPICP